MTLLFIHGAGCTGEVFDAQVRAFAGSIAPNLPGHLCAGSPQSVGEFADALENALADRTPRSVVLCGHSMGGAIALELALWRPPWLQGAVLMGAAARMRVAPAFLEGLQNDFEATARTIAAYFFAERSPEREEHAAAMMRAVGRDQTLRDFRACDAFDALDRLGEVAVPLLALGGEHDRLVPEKFVRALADRVPGAQARILTGAGHFVMAERPDETNQRIAAFLAGLP